MPANKKIKLLIISSYGRPCGIAQYIEHLVVALNSIDDLEVTVAAIPVDIFRSDNRLAKKKAKHLLEEICKACNGADVVNIQFEHGLYGKSPFQIASRLKKIIIASKKVFITHHTCIATRTTSHKLIKNIFNQMLNNFRRNYVIMYLLKICKRHPNNVYHIVHTIQDKNNMVLFGGVPESNIFNMPLSFLSQADKNYYQNIDKNAYKKKFFGLIAKDVKIIGVFGFLNSTKGIETAIKSLVHMPANYHLAIVGGLHPEQIMPYNLEQSYITILAKLIESKKLQERVHFIGAVNNKDFNGLMTVCDLIALPYAEVMQSSSGPAAIALDLGKPILCSHNRCFRELEKFAVDSAVFFQISNHLEFASKAKILSDGVMIKPALHQEYRNKYNVETRAQLYRTLCER